MFIYSTLPSVLSEWRSYLREAQITDDGYKAGLEPWALIHNITINLLLFDTSQEG